MMSAQEMPFSLLATEVARSFHPRTKEEEYLLAALWDHSTRGHLCLHASGDLRLFAPHEESLRRLIPKAPTYLQEKFCAFLCEEPNPKEVWLAKPIYFWRGALYLQRSWVYESIIAQAASHCKNKRAPYALQDPSCLYKVPGLEPEQKEALLRAFSSAFSLIVGGPGTGKSYTIQKIVTAFLEKHPKAQVAISAPTGKAVHHLGCALERSGLSITKKTLHALLGLVKNARLFFTDTPLPYDLIIIDECSMIDASLMAHLLYRIGENTHLILVGDPDQLPSVESGSVFRDLAEHYPSITHLKRAKRFEEPDLLTFSSLLLTSDEKGLQEFFIKSRSVSFLSTDFSQVETAAFAPFLEEYLQDYQEVESLEEAFLFMSRWQILATHVEGKMGVEFFNELLLRRAIALGKQALYLPIIWTKNDYVKHLYNGMAGIWIRYKNSPEKDQIVFPGEEAPQHLLGKISPKKAPYSLGFCLSVHKSQGSEFDRVLLSLGEGSEVFGKKLLYSAATRAKKKLHILGLKSTFTKTLAEDHWRDSQIGKRLLDFQG